MRKDFLNICILSAALVLTQPGVTVMASAVDAAGVYEEYDRYDDAKAAEDSRYPAEMTEEGKESSDIEAENKESSDKRAEIKEFSEFPGDIEESSDMPEDGVKSSGPSEDLEDYDEDRVLAPADSYEEAERLAAEYGTTLLNYGFGVATLSVSQGSTATGYLQRARDGKTTEVFPNYRYEIASYDDPYLSPESDCYQWMHGEDFLNTAGAWEYSRGEGITVAVLDTGVSALSEFGDRLLTGINVMTGTTDTADPVGHGTHVAGIIAGGAGDGEGGAGVAPEAMIYPVKCADGSGELSSETIARGINAAIAANVDIINYSAAGLVHGEMETQAWRSALEKGIVVVAAAGNDGTDEYSFPAALPGVISVAALDRDNTLAKYSNYGMNLDVAAPGTEIWSLGPKFSTYYLQLKSEGKTKGNYMCLDGTSMACPAVSGAVALMLSAVPSLKGKGKQTSQTVRNIIRSSSRDMTYYLESSAEGVGTIKGTSQVYGGLNVCDCVVMAKNGDKLAKPVIKTGHKDGKQLITIECPTVGCEIFYTTDGSSPVPGVAQLYTGPFELNGAGKITVKAIAVFGKKKSQAASYKVTQAVPPVSVSVNGGRPIYITPGKKVKLPVSVEPEYALVSSLTYRVVSGEGFTVDDKGYVTCGLSVAAGSSAKIRVASSAGAEAMATVVAKSSETNVVTVRDSLELVAVENDGTKAAGLTSFYDLSEDIKFNDQNTGYELTSSNPGVVKVVNNRYLKAVSKGKAVITVTATDGSGKKDKCKVKVLMPVLSIDALMTSTGFLKASSVEKGALQNLHFAIDTQTVDETEQVPIARTGRIKLTPYMNGDKKWKGKAAQPKKLVPSNKKMEYTVSGPGASGVRVRNGIVSCPGTAEIGAEFTVTARAADGFGAAESIVFKIYNDPGVLSFGSGEYKNFPGIQFIETPFVVDGKRYEGMHDYLQVSSTASYPYYDVSVDRNMIARGRVHTRTKAGGTVYYYRCVILKVGNTNISYKTKDGTNRRFGYKLVIAK